MHGLMRLTVVLEAQGFPWFRKGKSIPCASWQCLGGRKKPEPPSGLNQTGDIEAGRAVKAATASQADTQAVESMVAAQAENILKVGSPRRAVGCSVGGAASDSSSDWSGRSCRV